jgi:hypothetical protein
MDRHCDPTNVVAARPRDEAARPAPRRATDAWGHHTMLSRADRPRCADGTRERAVAELSADETRDAMYGTAGEIRLDLIYCFKLGGDFRKHWANRLGELNLRSASAAAEIAGLRHELVVYVAGITGGIDRDVMEIDCKLQRLRQLCLHHQRLTQSRRHD